MAKKIIIIISIVLLIIAFHFASLKYVLFYSDIEAKIAKRFIGSKAEEVYKVLKEDDSLDSLIEATAIEHDIPLEIWQALITIESNGDPAAKSHKGCIGLAQINPSNLKRCGLKSIADLYNPKLNLNCGAQILTEEYKIYKSWVKALAVYNCGKVSCPPGKLYAFDVIALSEKFQRS